MCLSASHSGAGSCAAHDGHFVRGARRRRALSGFPIVEPVDHDFTYFVSVISIEFEMSHILDGSHTRNYLHDRVSRCKFTDQITVEVFKVAIGHPDLTYRFRGVAGAIDRNDFLVEHHLIPTARLFGSAVNRAAGRGWR